MPLTTACATANQLDTLAHLILQVGPARYEYLRRTIGMHHKPPRLMSEHEVAHLTLVMLAYLRPPASAGEPAAPSSDGQQARLVELAHQLPPDVLHHAKAAFGLENVLIFRLSFDQAEALIHLLTQISLGGHND